MTNGPLTPAQQVLAETEMIARAASLGLPIDVDPDLADHMGAFEETALDDSEADESRFDVDLETGIVIDDPLDGETDQ